MSEPASHRSRDELEEAIRGLSTADWGRLHKIAAVFARHQAIEAQDLLQEAFRRALDGGRRWRKDLGVVSFLAGTMRSIAHGEREKTQKHPPLVAIPNQGETEIQCDALDPAPTAEQNLAKRQDAMPSR